MSRAKRRPFTCPEIWLLTAISAALHFWRLPPPAVSVFDEKYYATFAGNYLTGSYVFDVHPPLGRLMYAAVAWLLNLPGAALANGEPAPTLRLLPAAFGVALAPVIYALLREARASRKVATLGVAAIVFDNALLVDSRLA